MDMEKQKPLTWTAVVVRGDEHIPYESLTEEEKRDLAKRLNQRAIQTVARLRGYDVEFFDDTSSE